jgi:membrane-bound metal-dependent hydrolase YbcI (DUF457 family)
MTSGAHVGAGVISAYLVESLFHRPITPATLGLAIGFSLLPDLDTLWIGLRQWRQGIHRRNDHHTLFSHTPAFYLVVALGLSVWLEWHVVALFVAVTLGHLALDSWATDDGVMWLYPFRRQQYALLPRSIHTGELHGKEFYRHYYRLRHFVLAEGVLLAGGLIVTGTLFV